MQLTDAVFLPENILDCLPRGTLVTDLEWRVRYVNQTLLRALRCSAEDLLGEHLCSLAGKISVVDCSGELEAYLEHLTQAPPDQPEAKVVEMRIPENKIIRIAVQPYHPNTSERAGYLFMFVDITRQVTIDEMKNVFVAEASHELRTPMTSIKGSLELLLGGYAGELPAEATELLDISLAAVDRLIRLINDLLDIAKIEAGEMVLHLERVNIADSIRKSERCIRSLAEKHQVTIDLEADEDVAPVLADRDRIEQVITNLLSNALKYSPPDGIVQVCTRNADDAVRVSVIDRGRGIPADQVEKVFDRFHQLEGAKKGTGLGLTISRALIEQHGGRIWVESDFGHGATFHFELPAIPAE